MTEIRIATIGSGPIVRNVLCNLKRIPGICLEAVYSRQMETGKELADKYGALKVYTDLDDMLDDDSIDAVYIAAPNSLHYMYAKRALNAGKHVICEKPFMPELAMAEELISIAAENDLMLIEAVPTTFLPNFKILKDGLKKIGRVKLVQANYSQYSSRFSDLLNGRVTNIFNPDFAGGCLMDINYYNIYLTAALFGSPESACYYPNLYDLSAYEKEVRSVPKHIDSSGIMIMKYDGFMAECSGAKDTRGVNFYQIEGEKGFIYADEGGNGMKSVRIVTDEADEVINLQSEDRLFYEFKELSAIMNNRDFTEIQKRMKIMKQAVGIVENARKAAGLLFSGE